MQSLKAHRQKMKAVNDLFVRYILSGDRTFLKRLVTLPVRRSTLIRKVLGVTTVNDGNDLYIYDSQGFRLLARLIGHKKRLIIEDQNYFSESELKDLQYIVRSV